MPKYRLKTGSHTIHSPTGEGDPQVYTAGKRGHDILNITKEQAERWFDPGRLEPLSTEEAKEEKSTTTENTPTTSAAATLPTATTQETEWSAVLSQGVNDVKGVIAVIDNPDDLKALQREEEKSNSPRKMVLDAIEKRQGELKK